MKIKTSEATELQLDWLVAKCRGYFSTEGQNPAYWESAAGARHFMGMRDDAEHGVRWTHASTDWSEGGPIIEREKIDLYQSTGRNAAAIWENLPGGGRLIAESKDTPTILIAAMRCYVASKLGDEVDVPEELI